MTERLGDGEKNCLEDAATMARPHRDELVFMDDQRGADEGNANGAGHVLVRDRASGRVWDPRDGEAPANPRAWPHRDVEAWTASQGRAADGGPAYTEAGAVRAERVQDVLAAPPEARADRIAAHDDPALSAVSTRLYADDAAVDPIDQRAAELIQANSRRRGGHAGRNNPTPIINHDGIAAEIMAEERRDPARAAELRQAVATQLGDGAALDEALQQGHRYQAAAFRNLAGDTSGRVEVDSAQAEARASELIDQATRTRVTARGQHRTTYLDTNELSYQLERLAETDPALAVGTKLILDERLGARQTAEVNRLLGGGASIGENVNLALRHPGEIEGLLEGAANGFIELGEMFVQGSAMQAAGQQYQAAGTMALFGQDEQAERLIESANAQMEAARDIELPKFELENRAQEGWATVGVAADLAFAGYGLVRGGVRLVTKADDVAEIVLRNSDSPTARRFVGDLAGDGAVAARRGVDLDAINPDALVRRLDDDPRVRGLDDWLQGNQTSLQSPTQGAEHRLDHLNELRELERRLDDVPPGGTINAAETPIAGTTRNADLSIADHLIEVKTVREPVGQARDLTGQLAEGVGKFDGATGGGPREVVVYGSLADDLLQGTARQGNNLGRRYVDGNVEVFRLDTGDVVREQSFMQDMERWLNGQMTRTGGTNPPGLNQTDRITIRLENGADGVFVRDGNVWRMQ